MLTDGTGAITQEYEYGSYGELIRGDKKATRFLYNGAYGVMTDDNGLYYMRARYYNVSIRRFINQDVLEGSLTNSQSLNRYSYVQGNPVSLSDPFGLSPYMRWSETSHFILDMVGFIPGLGDVADLVNATWYALEGNWGMAGVSLMSAIPGIGSFIGQGVKLTVKGIDLGCTIAKTSKVIGYGYSSVRAGEAAGNGVIHMLDKYLVRKETLGWDTLGEAGEVALYTVAAVVSGKASVASSATRVCFTGETLVETSEGQKRIDEIREGEYVLSENPETKEVSYRRVEKVFENETETLIHVSTEKEQITTTPNHPFYVEGMGFVEAKDLKAGDRLKDADGRSVLVTSVEKECLEEAVRVYNLEVEEDHTYYVGRGKVLVHNRCDGGNASSLPNRRQALNEAKDRAGVPRSQQPERQWQVGDDINMKGHDTVNYRYDPNPTSHGRYYEYDTPNGGRVIVEHTNDGTPHTHAGTPKGNFNSHTYDFKNNRYQKVEGPDGDHHIYYKK